MNGDEKEMSKHARVNGKLLQLNKTYNNLKNKQKEKIAHWMVEETEMFYEKTGAFPTDSDEFMIVDNVYARIEAAEIWIPYDEIAIRYSKNVNPSAVLFANRKFSMPIFTSRPQWLRCVWSAIMIKFW